MVDVKGNVDSSFFLILFLILLIGHVCDAARSIHQNFRKNMTFQNPFSQEKSDGEIAEIILGSDLVDNYNVGTRFALRKLLEARVPLTRR